MRREFAGSSRIEQLKAAAKTARCLPRLLWQTDSRLTLLLAGTQALQTVTPVAQLWVAKLIVDRLVSALRLPDSSRDSHAILWLVVLEFGLAVLGLALREAINYWRTVLAEKLTQYVSTRILEHAQALDLEILERSDYYDLLRRAEESAFHRPAGLLFQLLNAFQGTVTLVALTIVLTRLHPLALPLLLLAAIPYAVVHSGAAVQLYALSTGETPEARHARYLSHLLSTDSSSKEIRVYGLAGHLLHRYREILALHVRRIGALARKRSIQSGLAGLAPAAVYAGIYAYFSLQALGGHISVGDLTLYVGVALRSQDVLQQTMFSLSGIVEHSLFLDDYFSFLSIQSVMPRSTTSAPLHGPIARGVRLEGVSYRYPGSSREAVSGLDLELPAGSVVALVGENGAGKTTVAKLLARLYDPAEGRITVDGQDIRDLDVDGWRRQIAVVFQDFVHYYLSVTDNIGFGSIDDLANLPRIVAAAERGGADSIVSRLPGGYNSILGRWFEGGVELSGGEWQRIALARAFMRDAPILVLDEPTASLDARSEYEVFRRFQELTRGRIVLLISHRFSTVRMADYIYVLDEGRVVDSGSHDELLRHEGRYADLFRLQAAAYR